MVKPSIEPKDDMFFTVTMAEVLEKQGHMEDALTIYKILLRARPDDPYILDRFDRLKELSKIRT